MYSNYGITYTDAPNCVRSGGYNGMESPYLTSDNQSGNFAVIRNHSQRERILQIDDQLIAAPNSRPLSMLSSLKEADCWQSPCSSFSAFRFISGQGKYSSSQRRIRFLSNTIGRSRVFYLVVSG